MLGGGGGYICKGGPLLMGRCLEGENSVNLCTSEGPYEPAPGR